jgi:DNA-binding NarL/FixJ family response regulator
MSTDKITNIIIADSQFLVVEALKMLIGANERYLLAGVAANQLELFKLLEKVGSGILITDIANAIFDCFDELPKIRQKYPEIVPVLLVNTINKVDFARMTKLGVKNIIFKTADKEELFTAIEAAIKGKKYYSDEILDQFLDFGESRYIVEDSKTLTNSEIEIVKLIAGGLTTKEIASKKNISYHTVNTHRKNIFKKMDVSNASELIILAIKAGWIDNIEYYI